MNQYLSFILLFSLIITASEAKPARNNRCRKSTPSKCTPAPRRHPAFPEPEERLRVVWSSDGLVGNRYFEQDGRHYVEIQELFPVGNGRYRIQSRTEETTAPPRGQPYPQPELSQEAVAAGRSQSWMDELAAVPAWPVTRPDENIQEVRPQEPAQPVAASQQSTAEEQARKGVEEQQARVIEPVQPRPDSKGNEERIAAEVHQEPRDMTREEAYARLGPVAAPREEPGRQYGSYDNYYDDIWYEPAGQRFYPRLLFSPRFGWREMTEEEILRIRGIRPISEFDPALAVTNSPFPASYYHRHEANPEKERYPVHGGGYQDPVQQSSSHTQASTYHYNPGAHPQTSPSENNVEATQQNRVPGQGGTWVFERGNWQFEPHDSVEAGPETTPQTASPVSNSGSWVFIDGAWQYKHLPEPTAKLEQPAVENPPEKMVGIPFGKVEESAATPKKTMVKVRKFHVVDKQVKGTEENQDNLREFMAKAVTMDHETEKNKYNKATDKDYSREHDPSQDAEKDKDSENAPGTKTELKDSAAPGQLPQSEGDPAHYLQKGNIAAVVYTEKDKDVSQEEQKEHKQKKEEEDKENKNQQGGSYFIKEGNIGAYIYSGGEVHAEDSPKDSDKSSQDDKDDKDESLLSPDEFKRLIPSEHTISRLQLKDHSGIKPCNTESSDSADGDFWLLRTRPCDENSREGRIILPNGEVLKFYGQPQLVYV